MASISLGLASLLGAGIAGGSSLASGLTQANAANNAANLQYQLGEQSLNFEQQQYAQNQANLAPWLKAGTGALSNLQQILAQPGQGWNQQFTAPTAAQAAAYPGEQFQLQQGENAVQNSAAAKGGLVSGNAATALNNYAQGVAQQDYGNVYNQAFNTYQQNYSQYNNQLNRLASLAGLGQSTATTLGQQGAQAANTTAGINSTIGSQVGQNINNAGAATASGYAGLGNSLGTGLTNYSYSPYLSTILGQALGGQQAQNYFNTQTANIGELPQMGTPGVDLGTGLVV